MLAFKREISRQSFWNYFLIITKDNDIRGVVWLFLLILFCCLSEYQRFGLTRYVRGVYMRKPRPRLYYQFLIKIFELSYEKRDGPTNRDLALFSRDPGKTFFSYMTAPARLAGLKNNHLMHACHKKQKIIKS